MTLLEIERLVRRISELLLQGGNPDMAPKLAGDYAAACHAANVRLQQCEAMIKAGDRHQAIQLAQTAPNLLDLVTVLEFRGADDWRALCKQNALPMPERIDARSVRALNDCYSEGIATDHPLYAAYRKAVLRRDDEEALRTLQTIARLNPSDTNAASELVRIEAKVIAARLDHLGGLLDGGDTALLVAAIEAIETLDFKASRPEGEVWRRAQTIRSGFMLDEIVKLKAASLWQEALTKLQFIRHLETELGLGFPAEMAQRLEALETWAHGEQEKDRSNREFRSLLAELHYRIQQSEEKDTSARYVNLPELRDDFEALNKLWRSLSDFTRPIPEEASAAFQKRRALLEQEIARRTAIRRRAILAGSTAVVAVGAVIVWFVLGQMRAREFAEQLQAAVSQRQARAAEQLLERLHTSEDRLLNLGIVNAAAANAESFVTRERGLLASFKASFAKLPIQLNGEPDAGRVNAIADQLAQTRTTLDALAPDLKLENEPRVRGFEHEWRRYLLEGGLVLSGWFEKWITDIEEQCSRLDYRAPVETATGQIRTLSSVVKKINDCESAFTNHVSLRSDLLQRASAARAKFTAYERELKKLDDGIAALEKARTFGEFSSAIGLMASSEFSSAPAADAAGSVQSLGATEEAFLRSLLGATNAATWAFLSKAQTASLMPEIAMPAERAFFQSLNADPAVNASHQHYRFWLDREGSRNVDWITAGSLDNSQGWKQIKAWTWSAAAAGATFTDKEYGYFDGQWRLSPTQLVYRVEQNGKLRDTGVFAELGLGKVWSGGSAYGKPLLEVLDSIKNSGIGSPVFRAFLFCRVVELMELQPDAWGLSLCPSARLHAARIRDIVGGEIVSGDWFVPAKSKRWGEEIDRFFGSVKPVSYMTQARGNLALARAVAKDGLRYVAFAGLDGKPNLPEGLPPRETWGYDTGGRPTLVSASAMPFSPLFALPHPRAEYLARAGVAADGPSFTGSLPPLFRDAGKL